MALTIGGTLSVYKCLNSSSGPTAGRPTTDVSARGEGEGGTASKSCKHTCVDAVKGALLVNRVNIRVYRRGRGHC